MYTLDSNNYLYFYLRLSAAAGTRIQEQRTVKQKPSRNNLPSDVHGQVPLNLGHNFIL